MHDDALISWLNGGAQVELTAEEAAAQRCRDFSLRFTRAMNPPDDLGPTEEAHEMEVARRVFAVHAELNALGQDDYSAVWSTLSAPVRRAIKAYVGMAKQ